ncbi:inositol monophosphatase [Rhodococcus pyridinivorans]|uniref:inositol monophosphatase family protein n=1 Tax=Rhodococcus pyridinivorans TaxID=103816 RepID=UPI00200A1FCE|nr:inositol monophosphatase family protein [Rhodococcus pyridinivorans]UPW06856.1 inositol monophosphatase [Rhodococcus pyridinivorans]
MCSDRFVHAQRTIPESELSALRDVAVTVAREAASYVRVRRVELFGPPGSGEAASVGTKSTVTDPVTAADTESEELIRRRLTELRPGDAFLGEETGADGGTAAAASGVVWVVDPIDGTVNFVYGLPASAVSVAARVDGRSVAGAVVDIASEETFSAAEGLGAHLDVDGTRVPLRCNPVTDPRLALVATGFSYSPARRARQGELVAALLPRVRDIRRVGAAALDLCMVAAGRVDAHYEHGLGPWDWAAGALVAAEAGAVVRVPSGTGDDGELTVAAAPGIAADFETLLAEIGALDTIPN